MLNVNSPTIQAMLASTPQGAGNIPMYYGNSPTVQSTVQPASPYPSPKDMVMQSGFGGYPSYPNQQLYNPYQAMQFGGYPMNGMSPMPQPMMPSGAYPVGFGQGFGYNNPLFQGYSNPYMGIGNYSGYGLPQYQYTMPMDEQTRAVYEQAQFNGLTYDQQIHMESRIWKSMSRVASAYLGRSEEEAERIEATYDVKYKTNESIPNAFAQAESKTISPMKVKLMRGDDIVYSNEDNIQHNRRNYATFNRNVAYVDTLKRNMESFYNYMTARNNYYYDNAVERKIDDTPSLMEFFNNYGHLITMDHYNRMLTEQNSRADKLYNKELFRARLEADKAKFDKGRDHSAVNRFIRGSNGIMPDGRPVSAGADPSVAEAFTIDRLTGQLSIDVPPSFMANRMKYDLARERFLRDMESS